MLKMKKVIRLLIISIALFVSFNRTLAYFNNSDYVVNVFSSKDYNINLNANGGNYTNPYIVVKNNKTKLPNPTRSGYNFLGYGLTENGGATYSSDINNIDEINNLSLFAKWEVVNYSISYNLNGGSISSQPTSYNVEQTFSLPTPTRTGYTFTGWTGTGLNTLTKNVTVSNSIGNRNYTANWSQNYYTVNYYVNGGLWTQRSVGYGNGLENLNAQSLLDNYHTFHGWNGWVNTMPSYDVNLYASITESFCNLLTGHGAYGNAAALLKVFNDAGWSGRIIETSSAPGYYSVETDYNLTRAEAEHQKNYVAEHTNYTNHNWPYLYWVSVSCTNGYSEVWTRGSGQRYFN